VTPHETTPRPFCNPRFILTDIVGEAQQIDDRRYGQRDLEIERVGQLPAHALDDAGQRDTAIRVDASRHQGGPFRRRSEYSAGCAR